MEEHMTDDHLLLAFEGPFGLHAPITPAEYSTTVATNLTLAMHNIGGPSPNTQSTRSMDIRVSSSPLNDGAGPGSQARLMDLPDIPLQSFTKEHGLESQFSTSGGTESSVLSSSHMHLHPIFLPPMQQSSLLQNQDLPAFSQHSVSLPILHESPPSFPPIPKFQF
ncbi:hypothetical protein C8R41DRAFT_918261 [Lentinula lateritia]|uniref:Uncharacterized protein n=1 Tax=Lentinula lateritia TaxID=40482 RepID=A0ABQ8VJU1_9AGAR|nr:hypothetical protein C8R41DRAFT_918261 [Lentinula lateritia]